MKGVLYKCTLQLIGHGLKFLFEFIRLTVPLLVFLTVTMSRKIKYSRSELIIKLETLHRESLKHGVTDGQFKEVFLSDRIRSSERDNRKERHEETSGYRNKAIILGLGLALVFAVVLAYVGQVKSLEDVRGKFGTTQCAIPNNEIVMEMARPRFDCKMCENLHDVPVESQITQEVFKELYAETAVPVLIKEATKNWTAMSTFSFQFFKTLYQKTFGALRSVEDECQFFPYKTEFQSLEEVFNMSDDRANFKDGEKPWYIGWSNCHKLVQKQLRQHYQKPYFLPNASESSQLDWMFMGGTGPGAFIHIDFVQRPSWQAQIAGKKTWRLIPSPECEDVCHEMNVTVHKGDIIVVDTNKWFHSTFIHPGEISITIGSEYE